MKNKYIWGLALALICFTAYAQEKKPVETVGPASAETAPAKPTTVKPEQAPGPASQVPAESPVATVPSPPSLLPEPFTENDYNIYLKSGHRDTAWDEWIKPGFESFDAGNYATSYIFLKKAYDKGCRDPFVLFRLGIYKESRGEAKEAAAFLEQAAEGVKVRYPDHPLAKAINRHVGRALFKADQYEKALPYLMEALKFEPDDFMLLLMAGQLERSAQRKNEARKLFEHALEVKVPEGITPDPKATVLGELIILTFDLKDFDACEKYIDQALKLNPEHKVAKAYRSKLQAERNKQKELEIIKKMTQ